MRRVPRGLAAGSAWALVAAMGVGHAAERSGPPEALRLGTCGPGSGGFLLPGTDACLTLGGYARAEGSWGLASPRLALSMPAAGLAGAPSTRDGNLGRSAFGTSARLTADMRVPTELGPVRVFVSLRGHNGLATERGAR